MHTTMHVPMLHVAVRVMMRVVETGWGVVTEMEWEAVDTGWEVVKKMEWEAVETGWDVVRREAAGTLVAAKVGAMVAKETVVAETEAMVAMSRHQKRMWDIRRRKRIAPCCNFVPKPNDTKPGIVLDWRTLHLQRWIHPSEERRSAWQALHRQG